VRYHQTLPFMTKQRCSSAAATSTTPEVQVLQTSTFQFHLRCPFLVTVRDSSSVCCYPAYSSDEPRSLCLLVSY